MEDRREGRKRVTDALLSQPRIPIPPPMSLLAAARRQSSTFVCASCRVRTYATKAEKKGKSSSPASSTKLPPAETAYSTLSRPVPPFVCLWLSIFLDGTSSCPPGTVLSGLSYLKGQSPVVALPDEDYPPWLWKLLEPRNLVDDGPGGKAEKIRLRKDNRQRIRDQNLLKTQ